MFTPLNNVYSKTPLQKGQEDQGFYEVGILFKEFCSQKVFSEDLLCKSYENKFPQGYLYFALKKTLPGKILFWNKHTWVWIYREMKFTIECSTTEIDQSSRFIEFKIPLRKLDGIYKRSQTTFAHSLFIVLVENYVDGIYCLTEHFSTNEVWLERVWENGLEKVKRFYQNDTLQLRDQLILIFLEQYEEDLNSEIREVSGDEQRVHGKKDKGFVSPEDTGGKDTVGKKDNSPLANLQFDKTPKKEIVPSLLVVAVWMAAVGVFLSMFMKGCTNTLMGKDFDYGTDEVGSTFAGVIVVCAGFFFILYLLTKNASNREK